MTISSNAVSTPPAAAPSQGYGSMNQLDSGPAALLYTLSNKLIKIYNELQASYNEMTQKEIDVQQKTINAAAIEQKSTASTEAAGYWCQAGAALAGAVVTAVTTGIETYKNHENNGVLEKQEEKLGKLNSLEKMGKTEGNNILIEGEGEGPLNPNHEVEKRASDMINGIFRDEDLAADQLQRKNQAAINTMEEKKEFSAFRKNLQTKIKDQQTEINSTHLKRQYLQTTWNQISQMASQVTNSGGQGGQAIYKNKSGEHQAGQQIESGVSNMAGGTAENTRSNIGQLYAKVEGVIGNAAAGAKAYAQS